MNSKTPRGGAPLLVILSLVIIAGLFLLLSQNTKLSKPGDAVDSAGNPIENSLILYCAAGIMKPVQAAADEYEKEFGVRIQIEPGGSGKLLSQIKITNGRGHLYLAADQFYTDQARKAGLVRETLPVSRIHPVIAVAPGNPKGIKSVADLLRSDVKVALANPELASVGKTVRKLLSASGQWDALEARSSDGSIGVSFTGTVNEVAQAIKIGSVDAGVIWDSNARQFELDIVEAEPLASSINTITIGVLEPNDRPTAALQFARYLTARDRGQLHFETFTYDTLEDADVWSDHPEVLLMAGAMLKPGIEDAIASFEKREGVTIKPIYNGCGILVAQMKTGLMPQAYFSCDTTFMDDVQHDFDPAVSISKNPMVIAVPKGNPKGIVSLEDLTATGLTLGFAHPVNSALGTLTDRMLEELGLHEKVYNPQNTVVHSDAGHMLVNQLRTGSLDAAIVYRSNAMANPENVAKHMDLIAIDLPQAIATQPFAISKNAEHKYLMQRLFETVTTTENIAKFKSLGFDWIMPSPAGANQP